MMRFGREVGICGPRHGVEDVGIWTWSKWSGKYKILFWVGWEGGDVDNSHGWVGRTKF